MTDFLLELRSEEIPARMQDKARDDLARMFAAELAKAGLVADNIATFATPRRLALIAYGLPLETQASSEEIKGPKTSAPPQAMEGFLRKTGLTLDQLTERDGVYFAVTQKAGRAAADVLAEAIPAIIRAFPWPKSQRWGAASASTESLRWVRQLQGIVALLGDDVVACEVDGIVSGAATMGHRFHHSGEITIGNAADYAMKLRAAHVILSQDERRDIIRTGAEKAASDAGLKLVPDEGLVNENAGLTEWPVPMLGRFDPAFLAVPQEVIQLTARVNQKYFVCESPLPHAGGAGGGPESLGSQTLAPTPNPSRKREGKLTNAFICTANINAHDGGAAIVAGNEKVLAARLSDAKFFWEADLKIPLETQALKLSSIVFHEKLGTVADKVERVAKLARWLVEEGIVGAGDTRAPAQAGAQTASATSLDPGLRRGTHELADMAERAARLCKADLVTGMVGEFPELQGIMGGYYARAQGEDDAVADAIRDHYKPVGQGDDVPTAPVTVAVSLADKLDTLVGFFAIDERPTGSKDPFALRRAALSCIALLMSSQIRLNLSEVITPVAKVLARDIARNELLRTGQSDQLSFVDDWFEAANSPNPFFRIGGRSVSRLQENGVNHFRYGETFGAIFSWIMAIHETLAENVPALLDFFADRLKVQQREAGVRHDLIDAVFALGEEDDLVRLLARVKALQAFVGTGEGADLLAGYKRAANILKGSGEAKSSPSTCDGEGDRREAVVEGTATPEAPPSAAAIAPPATSPSQVDGEELGEAERDLLTALNAAEPLAAAAIAAEDFARAMSALAILRAPIDGFFDKETGVMVNDPDPDKRAFRIGLLTRFRDAVHTVADFSKIEG